MLSPVSLERTFRANAAAVMWLMYLPREGRVGRPNCRNAVIVRMRAGPKERTGEVGCLQRALQMRKVAGVEPAIW